MPAATIASLHGGVRPMVAARLQRDVELGARRRAGPARFQSDDLGVLVARGSACDRNPTTRHRARRPRRPAGSDCSTHGPVRCRQRSQSSMGEEVS